jgi:hypothetical protein
LINPCAQVASGMLLLLLTSGFLKVNENLKNTRNFIFSSSAPEFKIQQKQFPQMKRSETIKVPPQKCYENNKAFIS